MKENKQKALKEYYLSFYAVFDPMKYGIKFSEMYVKRNELLFLHLSKYNELVEIIGKRKAKKIKKRHEKFIGKIWRDDRIKW